MSFQILHNIGITKNRRCNAVLWAFEFCTFASILVGFYMDKPQINPKIQRIYDLHTYVSGLSKDVSFAAPSGISIFTGTLHESLVIGFPLVLSN
jgi:hypothetical protein